MTECGDSSHCTPSLYLPSYTYYVSAADFTSVSSLLPQPSSCQVKFPYTPNIAQVQPVQEVAFKDYGLEHASKWHYKGDHASYYQTGDLMHRNLTQVSNRTDIIPKNDSMYSHYGGANPSSNFFRIEKWRSSIGIRPVFDTVNVDTEKPNPDPTIRKTEYKPSENTDCSKLPSDFTERAKLEPTECLNVESKTTARNSSKTKSGSSSSLKSRKKEMSLHQIPDSRT